MPYVHLPPPAKIQTGGGYGGGEDIENTRKMNFGSFKEPLKYQKEQLIASLYA